MNIKYLILILSIIFFGCNEPEVLSCPGGQIEDQCGACCDESSNLECSNGPNTGVMDACGTCFGEIQDGDDCIGLCTDPEAGNYNQPMYSSECPCNYNLSLIEIDCDAEVEYECLIIGPSEDEKCYMFIDNPVLEIDLKFLTENLCQGDDPACNNYNNIECCENIPSDSGQPSPCEHELNCEWKATFKTKKCRSIYFINTSEQDISIITTDKPNNELWNNFLDGESISANTVFNPETHTFSLQDICLPINTEQNICDYYPSDTEEDMYCSDYNNSNDCNNNTDNIDCHWYYYYSYVLGNTNLNGAFQSLDTYQFCLESDSEKCGEIKIE